MNNKMINITIAILCVISVWEFSTAGYIHAKAMVAQHLMSRAWEQSMEKGVKVPPWPWADTWPVASIKVPEHEIEQTILAGMNGRVLAFGPGWMRSSSRPAEQGTVVVAGHRDTHFEFLQYLKVGDELEIQGVKVQAVYEVASMEVIDSRYYRIKPNQADSSLILVTCYPFDSIATDGPLRYVVRAKKRLSGVSL